VGLTRCAAAFLAEICPDHTISILNYIFREIPNSNVTARLKTCYSKVNPPADYLVTSSSGIGMAELRCRAANPDL
jgi:hypothetical protein